MLFRSIIKSDANNDYVRDAIFGIAPQITGRAANSPINAAYAVDNFWDGRALSRFTDPQTGQVAIATGGFSRTIEGICREIDHYDETLTLRGLVELWASR